MSLARLTWTDPETNQTKSYDLSEGALVTIGRAASNEISIPHVTVSRTHAKVTYQDGMFFIEDGGSSNGTFLNDQQIFEALPLMSGDRIRLYGPEMLFLAGEDTSPAASTEDVGENETSPAAPLGSSSGAAFLLFLSGPQKDARVPLGMADLRIGRATENHTWEIGIQDASVSRPHARLHLVDGVWVINDLGSSNGTQVNNVRVTEKGKVLSDGDIITIGSTLVQFKL